jgi:hypothetical protein
VFTWNQLSYEVDWLSQTGHLRLTPAGNGHYALRFTQKRDSCETSIATDHSTARTIPIPSSVTEPESC